MLSSSVQDFNRQRATAFIPFAVLCLVVISAYIALKIQIVNRPPLQKQEISKRAPASPMRGKPVPSFALPDLNGKIVTMDQHRGKIVFINIWATWCAPCREEMPSMEALYNKLKGDKFAMLAISIDEDGLKSVGPFVEEYGLTFPILLDPSSKTSKKFKTTGVPETFIVNKDGIIIYHSLGPENWERPEFYETITKLINDQPI
ncbi:MAG: TlpA disulfide reductase family protein [Nitrospinota bacterium]